MLKRIKRVAVVACVFVGVAVQHANSEEVVVGGSSFVPLMNDPDLPWKEAILSRWKKGDTIRTQRYQYTEWRESDDSEIFAPAATRSGCKLRQRV